MCERERGWPIPPPSFFFLRPPTPPSPSPTACDDPTSPEMYDCVVRGLGLAADLQNKTHPADFMARGRVRVALVGLDGAPLNPAIPDRRTLLLRVAELVPRHPGRSAKAKAALAAAQAAAAGPSAAAGGGKKGGKKKGRR